MPKFLLLQRNLPGMLESFSAPFSLLSIPENRGCGDVTTREVPAFPGEPRFPGSLQPKQLFEQECVILEYFPVKTLIFPLNRTNAGCAQVQEHHNKALNSCMEMGTVNFGSSSCIPCASSGGIPNSWLWTFSSRPFISVTEERTWCPGVLCDVKARNAEVFSTRGVWKGVKWKFRVTQKWGRTFLDLFRSVYPRYQPGKANTDIYI